MKVLNEFTLLLKESVIAKNHIAFKNFQSSQTNRVYKKLI